MKLQQLVSDLECQQLKSDLPKISIGDTVSVGIAIQEGNKKRIQTYEGIVIAKHHGGMNTTITVRKIFQGIGIERIFLIHSASVQELKVLRKAKVRKAKLYYLRERVGKATHLKEKFDFTKKKV